nr:prolyl 4-hydroxylase subunit alpha-1 [Drosophila kikkawai]
MQMTKLAGFLWLLQLLLLCSFAGAHSARGEEQLEALLDTETQLINELRDYIERMELQLEEIRKETAEIEEIHSQVAADNVEEHMGNPLNVLTILKRFETVWPKLEQQANATIQLSLREGLITQGELTLPTEEEYEESLSHLLHLQSVYELEPASLSLGVVNGLKLGSAMSWGDCLELARESDFSVARFWLETALNKLPGTSENSTESQRERERGRVKILETKLNMEYRAGEHSRALAAVEELILLLPKDQGYQKAKAKIEQAMANKELPKGKRRKSKRTKTQKAKSAEQLLIEELCRGAAQEATTGSRLHQCQLARNTPWTLLQPAKLEPLSSDPHIVLHHDVLTAKQAEQLMELMDEEEESAASRGVSYQPMKLSKLAQKKLKSVYRRLGLSHQAGESPNPWQGRRHGHGHATVLEKDSELGRGHAARGMLSLQAPGMGGAVVFPQLELGVNVPRGDLLLWHTRTAGGLGLGSASGHGSEWDYRSRQAVCPVLLGAQLSAWTGLS